MITDRKFTPPTEFPVEYVTGDGHKVVILGMMPCDEYPYVGYIVYEDGSCGAYEWKKCGFGGGMPSSSLHDLPKKRVRWMNHYSRFPGDFWCNTREEADAVAGPDRIAVIRCEWTEGQPPQCFVEDV